MLFNHFTSVSTQVLLIGIVAAVQRSSPSSEVSGDEKNLIRDNKTSDLSEESHEEEMNIDDDKDKRFLEEALKTVLDPKSIIVKSKDPVEFFNFQLEDLKRDSLTLNRFMEEMDIISLEVCKTSQEALWAYVTDVNNENKKNKMVKIAAQEDEIKKQYWNILKNKYMNEDLLKDPKMIRKIRIIKERGTNVQMPQSKQREEIDTMQRIWSRVTICAYNVTGCKTEESRRTMSDVISIFKTSNDSKELAYYWKVYRDATGRKIRPIFKDYVIRMNNVAVTENFTDAGDMWRYVFEDDQFMDTVDRLWKEIKPFYNLLHNYVRIKLKSYYKNQFQAKDRTIPAHLLGNLWAQEWQAIYPKIVFYPNHIKPTLIANYTSKDLFDAADDFHQSLGFESAKNSYEDIQETMTTANCLPSSHDMCDGVNYKIKWCGEEVTDVAVTLSRAARLLGHVQYFKQYRHLPQLYRDGPNPAFHDAISDIVAVQLTSPSHLKTLKIVDVNETGHEVMMNHLLWVALEKFPLMAYAYVLDKWRWNVFGNTTQGEWNQNWWNLRTSETGVSPPIPRNESDLDPAAKYHVVSHVQYITYLISHVLEFQILLSLCKKANHTGPLHKCSIYGVEEAGKLLSNGMSLGASEDWRTVLEAITGERELSTRGILEYFASLKETLEEESIKSARSSFGEGEGDIDRSTPIIVGGIAVLLTIVIVVLFCVRKHNVASRVFSVCGLSKNGSLDIVSNEMSQGKASEIVEGVSEDKV